MKSSKSRNIFSAFFGQRSGSVTIIFGLAAVAIFLFVGIALDYGKALSRKTVLTTAADAAALAALGQAESNYAAGNLSTLTSDAQAAAQRAFVVNAGQNYSLLTHTPPDISVQRNGQVVTATVAFQAQSPNVFGPIVHISQMTYSGSAASSMTLPSYLNFYLLLDVSASMGIPSTASEINRLAAINPDYLNLYPGGCTIACHFTAYRACQNASGATVSCQGYNLTRPPADPTTGVVPFCPTPGTTACIQLRLDAVAYATQKLISTATATQTLPNQFQIGLYPFVRWMQPYQALTSNLSTVSTAAAGLPGLIDNGYGSSSSTTVNGKVVNIGLGSGGTHFENALTSMNTTISTVGDGTSASSPKPFVFMVTDGAQDNQIQTGGAGGGAWSGSNHATTLDTANCTTLKNRGVTLAVLYVPYVPIPNPTTIWGDEDHYANNNIASIPPVLQSCASPGFFFTASTPDDINHAMQAMFRMAVANSHLTQ